MKTAKPTNAKVYYQGLYWNDLPEVREYMSQNLTGDKNKWWTTDFQERFAPSPFQFKKALFLCDGNGWLSREFIDKKIVKQAVSFDWSADLLAEAESKKGKRTIQYFQADVNTISFKAGEFDLIVNNAALHHVQYLNRLLHILASALQPDGLFVNFDYIGPQRNQYSFWHWRRIFAFNQKLPSKIQHEKLHYPHLPTMLATDPTEAIHSDQILETMSRYFDITEQHDTNGGLAYHLLTHNKKVFALKPLERKSLVKKILSMDQKLTAEHKVPVLFSYFIAQSKKQNSVPKHTIKRYLMQENSREKIARLLMGSNTLMGFFVLVTFRLIATLRINKIVHKFL